MSWNKTCWTRAGGLKFHFLRLNFWRKKLGKMSRKCQKKSPQNCTKNVPKIDGIMIQKLTHKKWPSINFAPKFCIKWKNEVQKKLQFSDPKNAQICDPKCSKKSIKNARFFRQNLTQKIHFHGCRKCAKNVKFNPPARTQVVLVKYRSSVAMQLLVSWVS